MSQKLKVGDKVPAFSLPDQNGNTINLADYLGKQPVVIYFYPKDDTPGCTAEACSFRDQYEDFKDAGAEVFGISSDSPQKHAAFAKRHGLPFVLLSDEHKRARKLMGVPGDLFGLLPGRVTYVVDDTGAVVHIFNSQLKAERHVKEAIQSLRRGAKAGS